MLHHYPDIQANVLSLLVKLDSEQAELVIAGLCSVEREEREKAAQAEQTKLPGWRHLRAYRLCRAEIAGDLLRKIGAHFSHIAQNGSIYSGRRPRHQHDAKPSRKITGRRHKMHALPSRLRKAGKAILRVVAQS